MRKFLQQIGLCTIFLVVVASQSWARSDIISKWVLCHDYQKRMTNYQKDFFEFAKVQTNNLESLEYDIAMRLCDAASNTSDYLVAVADLLAVYQLITKNADRVAVKPIIKECFRYYAKATDCKIEYVNQNLAHTKNPAIAASGTRLKEDLREIKTLLESIELP